jgi:plastocyanin
MRTLFFTFVLILAGSTGFSTTWTITNSGNNFNPSSITITLGDDIIFSLSGEHNAVEVSQATYNSGGTTPLTGGFATPLGGGSVSSAQLGVGVHYYVCQPHASLGMKGIITVQTVTDVRNNLSQLNLIVYPNPVNDIMTIKWNSGLSAAQYNITDQAGRIVFTSTIEDEIAPVDISHLSPGIYFVQIVGIRTESVKVIKK